MKKEEVLKYVEELVIFNKEIIRNKEIEIKNGGNKKSLESVICGINKNVKLLELIGSCVRGEDLDGLDLDLISRLKYKEVKKYKEVDKKEVIEKDLIDRVVIKKVDGVNKYFIEC